MNQRPKQWNRAENLWASIERWVLIIGLFCFNHRTSGPFRQRWVAHLLVPLGPQTVQMIKERGRDPLYIGKQMVRQRKTDWGILEVAVMGSIDDSVLKKNMEDEMYDVKQEEFKISGHNVVQICINPHWTLGVERFRWCRLGKYGEDSNPQELAKAHISIRKSCWRMDDSANEYVSQD